jgi:hypothetical protein
MLLSRMGHTLCELLRRNCISDLVCIWTMRGKYVCLRHEQTSKLNLVSNVTYAKLHIYAPQQTAHRSSYMLSPAKSYPSNPSLSV